jgi:phosphoribosyl 1,2-cyclic phosphodiesterase
VRVFSLGSGSRGNGIIVADGERAVLVDCGFGPRALAKRIAALGLQPEMIEALIITHEHQDHADGVTKAHHKWRWPVYASAGTHRALRDVPAKYRHELKPGTSVTAGAFAVESVGIPHDAIQPLAVAITESASGARVGIAHDLGAVPRALEELFARCDALCLEANHDAAMLKNGPYPPSLQARISGGRGHLNNEEAGALAVRLSHRGLKALALLHLSESNNTPSLAAATVNAALQRAKVRVSARAAAGRTPEALFALSGTTAPMQFALGL